MPKLPDEIISEILLTACARPFNGCPPDYWNEPRFSVVTRETGVVDAARMTDLMCLNKRQYAALAPLLYNAPMLFYPSQVVQFERTLRSRPDLARLVRHLFIGGTELIRYCKIAGPFLPFDLVTLFDIVPEGVEFPLCHYIEYDIAETACLIVEGLGINPHEILMEIRRTECKHEDWMSRVFMVRGLIKWARWLALHHAHLYMARKSPFTIWDIRHTFHPHPEYECDSDSECDITSLDELYTLAAYEARESGYFHRLDEDDYDIIISQLGARPGTRFDVKDWAFANNTSPLPKGPDITLEITDAVVLNTYKRLDKSVPKWLRIVAARVISYAICYTHKMRETVKGFVLPEITEEDPVHYLFEFMDTFYGMGDIMPLTVWRQDLPTPAPIEPKQIAKTLLNTLVLPYADVFPVAKSDDMPQVETLMIGPPKGEEFVEHDQMPSSLRSVKRLLLSGGHVSLRTLHEATRPDACLGQLDNVLLIRDNGIVRVKRDMLTMLDEFLRETGGVFDPAALLQIANVRENQEMQRLVSNHRTFSQWETDELLDLLGHRSGAVSPTEKKWGLVLLNWRYHVLHHRHTPVQLRMHAHKHYPGCRP
ncbi:hypothetical protein MCUN1_002251 [Malassezia cuniculi]|uniref:Uncharacterized protein n=1 Tax=Malassezia cuniculi TaxID=948313 RepID=A0AAF0J6C1_9BASI|nr:hypothetical protein MCUN1_002251 [Malassezia cuniculi]